MSKTVTSRAGNPAQLPFSSLQYLKCNPVLFAIPVVSTIGGIIIGLARGLSLGIGAGLGLLMGFFAAYSVVGKAKDRWQNGNLCAALVVSEKPYTIAVLADLCNDRSGPKLAIKIRAINLGSMAGGPPKRGDKLCAISLYYGRSGTGAWADFSPMVANCGCSDLNQIKRAVDSIDPRDWQVLSQAMKSLKPTDLGLHHIKV